MQRATTRVEQGRRKRRGLGPIKYDVYEHREGWKERRLIVGSEPY